MQQDLTITDLQKKVHAWIEKYGVRYFDPLTNLGILQEETGELSRHIVRQFGEQSYKEKNLTDTEKKQLLADEMADVLWVLCCLANQTGVDLNAAMVQNFEKKTGRDGSRHLENEKLK